MQKLADEMIFYIRFLEKEYGLEISLCDLHERIFPYSNLLTPYHTHRNHSCVLLKKYAYVCVFSDAERYAAENGTISYEALCRVGSRSEKIYVEG